MGVCYVVSVALWVFAQWVFGQWVFGQWVFGPRGLWVCVAWGGRSRRSGGAGEMVISSLARRGRGGGAWRGGVDIARKKPPMLQEGGTDDIPSLPWVVCFLSFFRTISFVPEAKLLTPVLST